MKFALEQNCFYQAPKVDFFFRFIDNNCNSIDCDDDFEVVYPITLVYETENTVISTTIESEEMLEEMNEQYCDD